MTFHRPCHRSSVATNAHVLAPAIGYSIGYHRPCYRRCSIPSYSPKRWKRPRARISPRIRSSCAVAPLGSNPSRQISAKRSNHSSEGVCTRVANQAFNTSPNSLRTCERGCDEDGRDLLIGTSVLNSAIPGWLDRTSIRQSYTSGVKINIDLVASGYQSRSHGCHKLLLRLAFRHHHHVTSALRQSDRRRNAWSLAQPSKASTRKNPGRGVGAPENPRSRDMRPICILSRPALPNPCHQCARR
jgi:hypothetical protein